MSALVARSTLFEKIKEAQLKDSWFRRIRQNIISDAHVEFQVYKDGSLRFRNQLCTPANLDLKKKILEETYCSGNPVHPRGTNMHRNLKETFWWRNVKREIATFVSQ